VSIKSVQEPANGAGRGRISHVDRRVRKHALRSGLQLHLAARSSIDRSWLQHSFASPDISGSTRVLTQAMFW